MIGLTGRKIRDLMYLLVLIVFHKMIDKTSEQFEAFFPCRNRLFFSGRTGDFLPCFLKYDMVVYLISEKNEKKEEGK